MWLIFRYSCRDFGLLAPNLTRWYNPPPSGIIYNSCRVKRPFNWKHSHRLPDNVSWWRDIHIPLLESIKAFCLWLVLYQLYFLKGNESIYGKCPCQLLPHIDQRPQLVTQLSHTSWANTETYAKERGIFKKRQHQYGMWHVYAVYFTMNKHVSVFWLSSIYTKLHPVTVSLKIATSFPS